ncbi:hypothetical protein B0H15DRAFT_935134 [Mycena belliarum]|uniref:Uncharacterized protein n=1 Tax=Mycena belliarum TaxID=1033014 RepID=A0AAD6XLI6_9AGAR|nr:hypothetical protein B0H15DRAFT_935134 [Mycena belliae]
MNPPSTNPRPSPVSPSIHFSVPIQSPTPEFLRLERSIRALSTAVHEIQVQCDVHTWASSNLREEDHVRSKVFKHLATLLTTGSPVGRQTIAVTGGSSQHGFYINALETVERNSHPPPREPAVKLTTVLPSWKTLQQLARDKRPISDITLTEHAADVFQALRLLSHQRTPTGRRAFDCFIVKRCRLEINRRLRNAVGLLDCPLHYILSRWDLHAADQIHEEWLVIPYPPILIENFSIPYRRLKRWPDCLELLFNRKTFSAWKTLFSSLLMVVLSTVTGLESERSESPTDAVLALHFLRLFLSFGPAQVILEVPSLQARFLKEILPQHRLDPNEHHENSPSDTVFRAWNAVVAYDSAISSLTSRYCTASTVLRDSLPTVHVIAIHAPSPSASRSMDSPRIMRAKVIPALKLNKFYIAVLETMISECLAVTEFPGAVHSEASMMGIGYAIARGKCEPMLQTAFHDAFEAPSNTIATCDRPCQICAWLAEELLLPNGPFTLSTAHGKTVPWTPPRVGIPLAVLRSLEVELLDLLTDTTQRWLEEKTQCADTMKL